VTYRPTATEGTGVDTLTAQYIAPRAEVDPVLDSRVSRRRNGLDYRSAF
jgi:hypothetical protein